MYKVNDKEFQSFLEAVIFANTIDAKVYEIATGLERWSPAPKVSSKRMLRYLGQKNAFEAQERLNNL